MARNPDDKPIGEWAARAPRTTSLRIIGGDLRGRSFLYSGDPVTRPMKDNIREAVFNLVGAWMRGAWVIDLFAGTGALGFEALSRGAAQALFIERHVPTAKIIQRNLQTLGLSDRAELVMSDTFFWQRQFAPAVPPSRRRQPWVVFCSPPYALYTHRAAELVALLASLVELAPPESTIVVESDERFDPQRLPHPTQWRLRTYAPARIALWRPGRTVEPPSGGSAPPSEPPLQAI